MNAVDLSTIVLGKGSHNSSREGTCLLEAVALFAGEAHSDHPSCASPLLTNYGISLNDYLPAAKRQELIPLIPRIVGTRDDGHDETRSYLALDWLIRTYTPAFLDLAGLTTEATELRDLRRIVDIDAARAAGPVVRSARTKAAAAWDAAGAAAWAAAWDAAGDAAGAAAWDAAWDAAGAAAGAAAWDAAWDAAGAAAWDAAWDAAGAAAGAAAWDAAGAAAGAAAWDALAPTVTELQTSAIDLFARMINPTS